MRASFILLFRCFFTSRLHPLSRKHTAVVYKSILEVDNFCKIGYNMLIRKQALACRKLQPAHGGTEKLMQEQNTPMEQDEMMDEVGLYTLVDEEGNEKLFDLIDMLEENGQVYFALIPHIEDPNELLEGEVELVVLNAKTDDDGNEILEPIESDEEYERIAEIFINRLDAETDEEDDEEE